MAAGVLDNQQGGVHTSTIPTIGAPGSLISINFSSFNGSLPSVACRAGRHHVRVFGNRRTIHESQSTKVDQVNFNNMHFQ
jgi:hypothetical protein